MKPSILLVEDESSLREVITMNLEMENYNVTTAVNGLTALELAENNYYDLMVLDVMLPELNGFELCEKIRSNNRQTPILFMSAKSSSTDRIEGLKLGADDYLAKPFDLEELLLRIKALLKRGLQVTSQKDYLFGEQNIISFIGAQASNGKETKVLTKLEMDLLQLLITRTNQVVSREDILTQVWGYDVVPNTRTIDNFILAFRKFFEKNPKQPKHFISIWGVGYKFSP